MRTIGLIALVALATGPAVACSLNPQPLPPFDPDGSLGLSPGSGDVADAGAGSADDGSSEVDSWRTTQASTPATRH